MRLFDSTLAAVGAVAIAVGMSVSAAQAIPTLGASAVKSGVERIADKPKAKKARPGGCGTMKYYSMKEKKCMDAMVKKV